MNLATELRRLAGPDDGTPEGLLRVAVTASIGVMNNGITYARYGSPELRMKHYVRLRAALLALAEEAECLNGQQCPHHGGTFQGTIAVATREYPQDHSPDVEQKC